MHHRTELAAKVAPFLEHYNQEQVAAKWREQSQIFQSFWNGRIMASTTGVIPDSDCDQIIRFLDRGGKGNTEGSEAIARAMIPQGAWRRMLNELHANKALGFALDRALKEIDPTRKAAAIDEVYTLNGGQRNYLSGRSGNAVGALIAAFDPTANLSMISLNDRHTLIDYLNLDLPFDWEESSIGTRIAHTNGAIMAAAIELGLPASARTITAFFYEPLVKPLWRDQQHLVQLPDRNVSVSVPTHPEDEEEDEVSLAQTIDEEIRESMQIQALLAKIGVAMGCKIWLPRSDRSRVLKAWTPQAGQLLDVLPLGFESTTIATIEQIDVLWLKGRSIVRAFEVEHTTSIYSGLLRMADLVALQPNLNVKLHIVADAWRRAKVLREIQRPVFSLQEGTTLRDLCTYLSYDAVREIGELPYLEHLSEKVLSKFEVRADDNGDMH